VIAELRGKNRRKARLMEAAHTGFEIEQPGEVNRLASLIREQHHLLRWTITAAIGGIRYFTSPDFTALPSAGHRKSSAGTIEGVFLKRTDRSGQEARPIRVWTETNDVASEAMRACNAMANSAAHSRSIERKQYLT
jgi:hypothetical protein